MNPAAGNTAIKLSSGGRRLLVTLETVLMPLCYVLTHPKYQGESCVDDLAYGWPRDASLRPSNGY